MEIRDLDDLRRVFGNKIIPLLREYFYGNPARVGMVLGNRFVVRKENRAAYASGDWGVEELDEKDVFQFADPSVLSAADFVSIYANPGAGL
jgi:hypothetical protein